MVLSMPASIMTERQAGCRHDGSGNYKRQMLDEGHWLRHRVTLTACHLDMTYPRTVPA